ncbi:hypothetical protein DRN32_06980 [Thermococci archaeon]|nr:MAG: hypothetical protein DRN32_06980 [Thermococci archaeon]
MLKGKNKFETWENVLIFITCLGAFILSTGIGLTAISPKGFPALLAMVGSLISFLSIVALIFLWFLKEIKGA